MQTAGWMKAVTCTNSRDKSLNSDNMMIPTIPTPEEIEKKGRAFIWHIERILGAEENCLREPIMKILMK